jgi:hypothetical protein
MHRSYCTKFVTDDFAIQRIPTAKDYIGDGVIVSQAPSLHSLCGATAVTLFPTATFHALVLPGEGHIAGMAVPSRHV